LIKEDKMKSEKIVGAVMVALVGTAVALGSSAATAKMHKKDVEKCYGISKKGKNDCAVKKGHSCAAQAAQDKDPKEWIYVMKGNCKRIPGGSLKPKG
jgi:uncharacterized membrane protein